MTTIPVALNPDKTISVLHIETSHVSKLTFDDVQVQGRDGVADPRFVRLKCTTCGEESIFPISGGSHPEIVQKFFAYALQLAPDRADQRRPAITTWNQAKARIKEHVIAMDGPERWMIEDLQSPNNGARSGRKMQEIVWIVPPDQLLSSFGIDAADAEGVIVREDLAEGKDGE